MPSFAEVIGLLEAVTLPPRHMPSFLKGVLQSFQTVRQELRAWQRRVGDEPSGSGEEEPEPGSTAGNLAYLLGQNPAQYEDYDFQALADLFDADLPGLADWFLSLRSMSRAERARELLKWDEILQGNLDYLGGGGGATKGEDIAKVERAIDDAVNKIRRSLDSDRAKDPFWALEVLERELKFLFEGMEDEDWVRAAQAALDPVWEAKGRLEVLDREQSFSMKAPQHGSTETMYHASVNAAQLYKTGFSITGAREGSGLGGGQNMDDVGFAISFTYDLFIAREIARALKTAVMIAKGDVKARDVIDWAKRDKVFDTFTERARMFRLKDVYQADTPEDAMDLYKAFLFARKLRKGSYDPGIGTPSKTLVRSLRKVNPKDVGVLAVTVDMTHPSVYFRAEEREFRVSPVAVISIDKLIR